MKEPSIPVVVHILDKEYRVACQRGEEQALLDSARFVDRKMREIKSAGKVIGTDRIAVMTALNLAHELLEQRSQKEHHSDSLNRRLQAMQEKIDRALGQAMK